MRRPPTRYETDNDPCPNTQCPQLSQMSETDWQRLQNVTLYCCDLGQRNVGMLSQATPGGGPGRPLPADRAARLRQLVGLAPLRGPPVSVPCLSGTGTVL